MSNAIAGSIWSARNWSADEGEGSIHDDDTARELGFRGGTVAGDVHMNQFPPLLVSIFGDEWFERGNLSLNFKNATVDLEKVQVFAEPLAPGASQVAVWMEREDGLLVCKGTAALGDHDNAELQTKDLRACEPSELRILNGLTAGMSLGDREVKATADRQFDRYDNNFISDPLDWYRDSSPWGGVIAAPSTILEFLWGTAMEALGPLTDNAVGLFGAIEIGQVNGPLLLNRNYRIQSKVICVGQSPQTEFVWYDAWAGNEAGEVVATMRMQSRVMKASSPAYRDE